jgi:hypothetical protein
MLIDPKLAPFLNTDATPGIIRIYNMQSDKSLLLKSNDLIKDIKNIRFQLDLNMYSNKELQNDYAKIGLEVFALDPYKILVDGSNQTLDELFEESQKELIEKNVEFF